MVKGTIFRILTIMDKDSDLDATHIDCYNFFKKTFLSYCDNLHSCLLRNETINFLKWVFFKKRNAESESTRERDINTWKWYETSVKFFGITIKLLTTRIEEAWLIKFLDLNKRRQGYIWNKYLWGNLTCHPFRKILTIKIDQYW